MEVTNNKVWKTVMWYWRLWNLWGFVGGFSGLNVARRTRLTWRLMTLPHWGKLGFVLMALAVDRTGFWIRSAHLKGDLHSYTFVFINYTFIWVVCPYMLCVYIHMINTGKFYICKSITFACSGMYWQEGPNHTFKKNQYETSWGISFKPSFSPVLL